jgi:hypothetical protein
VSLTLSVSLDLSNSVYVSNPVSVFHPLSVSLTLSVYFTRLVSFARLVSFTRSVGLLRYHLVLLHRWYWMEISSIYTHTLAWLHEGEVERVDAHACDDDDRLCRWTDRWTDR